jgi:hypothetical protein
METEREPDHSEDPRRQGTGSGGYPESNPEETTPDTGSGPQPGGAGGGDTGDAPSTSTPEEADREDSTGNPGAAG